MPPKFLLLFFTLFVLNFSIQAQFIQKPLEKPQIDTNAKKRSIVEINESTKKLLKKSKNAFKNPSSLKAEGDEYLKKLGISNSKTARRRIKSKLNKKLQSKDEFLGIKIEEKIGSYGSGNRATVEKTHTVKYLQDEKINPYLLYIYCYDPDRSQVVYLPIEEAKNKLICHGEYEKYVDNQLIERGKFNMGGKEGRWEEYDRNFQLLNKTYFKNGFPEESQIIYYDKEEKKIKEVIPIRYGKMTGTYYAFYESGNLKESGDIEDGVKIGRWLEYYEFGRNGKLKREWQFGQDKFDESEPELIQERDQQ